MAAPISEPGTVFLVEDDAAVRDSLTFLLELSDLKVESFASAQEFLSGYDSARPGCLVLDVHLPGMSGVELHDQLVRGGSCVPTIFITGHAPPIVTAEDREHGVVAVFEKPCPPRELIDVIKKALIGATAT